MNNSCMMAGAMSGATPNRKCPSIQNEKKLQVVLAISGGLDKHHSNVSKTNRGWLKCSAVKATTTMYCSIERGPI